MILEGLTDAVRYIVDGIADLAQSGLEDLRERCEINQELDLRMIETLRGTVEDRFWCGREVREDQNHP